MNDTNKSEATPYQAKSYKIPHAYVKMTKKHVGHFVNLGILQPLSHSRWLSTCFIIPKKDGGLQFITDFRKLNKSIVSEPCKYDEIEDTLETIGNFKYDTTINLIMGYYGMHLKPWIIV